MVSHDPVTLLPLGDFGPHLVGAKLHVDEMPEVLRDVYSVDVETDGTEKQSFVGIAICGDLEHVYYFTKLTEPLIQLLKSKKLVGHSFKDDLHFLKSSNVEIPINQFVCDTMLMSYVNDSSRRKHGLKLLCKEIFGHEWPTYEDMTYGHKVSLRDVPVDYVARYCGMDALETFRLMLFFLKHLSKTQKRLLYQMEMPENRILFNREDRGILIDNKYIKGLRERLKPEIRHLEALLVNKAVDIGFTHKLKKGATSPLQYNPNSPPQGKAFFNRLGFKVDGAAAEDLEPYSNDPVVAVHQEFKHLSKLIGTYIDPTLENPTFPVIHTRFNQTVVITGRLSSSGPNLQNIPSKGIYGPMFRKMFVARPGCVFLDADYSQMDLRMAAHMSQDEVMLEAFHKGLDIHLSTAAEVFGKKLEAVTKAERTAAKTINFGVVYGEGAKKLGRSLGISEDKAQSFLDKYFKRLWKLEKWITSTKRLAHKKGGVSTMMGRFIQYPALDSPNRWVQYEAERQCVNAIIQGSNGDILKLVDARLEQAGVLALITVHDEMLVEVPDNRGDIVCTAQIMKEAMENTVKLSVPLTVDVCVGSNWSDAKDEANRIDKYLEKSKGVQP